MAADDDDDDKTEEPTQRKLDQAREKGDIHRSNELVKVIENAASSARS
jgi:flagellar biosynthetic protein FlhB